MDFGDDSPKLALITGASSGIGTAVALKLAEEGHHLYLIGRSVDSLHNVEEDCRNTYMEFQHDKSLVQHGIGDVGDERDCERLVDACVSHFKGRAPDVAVLNAGVGRPGAVDETTVEDFDLIMKTNVKGVFLFMRKLLPLMKARGSGQIVVTSSVLGLRTCEKAAVYCASKYAVEGLVDATRKDFAGTGVKLGVCNPAAVATPWWESKQRGGWEKGEADTSNFLTADDVAEGIMSIIKQSPMCDIGRVVMENVTVKKRRRVDEEGEGKQLAGTGDMHMT
ncbi:unnamed protein product [Vitrella brassicaformis CCMP3155]|uniref:Uncharacterized protein n=1 Tax=Vitrella brassicaformis (strain CCMP3155) TaxID=1169540 RepID=A0A0G4EF55_VITBC|nr:unnamed protein product [Vitrella brassicaformis CCMP3155]|eukprot:CEL94596.1 unnamed protein product [Vitrella brassicaformis CCMP3155]